MIAAAPFDRVAERYDADFTSTQLGRLLRRRVWRHLQFEQGQHVLELGCGTGEDALWLASRGVRVLATDVSEGMLAQARLKAGANPLVEFERQDANSLSVSGTFDGAVADFGVLNCVADLRHFGEQLAAVLRPGARTVAVVMPPFCLWETMWYLLHFDTTRAIRRWRACVAMVNGAQLPVWYPSARELQRQVQPWFAARHVEGLGALLPPPKVSRRAPEWLGKLDERAPLGYLWADHYIAVLERR
ncbi:MAG TPA: methyltransferase domain-containing protein [Chloroflexota bacterium]|jgi:ubiquinone/menaquinone biosynthesis C-methylase UbiE|nr:methyltransferase domain-containing protein [Chloroflexota bacterium]